MPKPKRTIDLVQVEKLGELHCTVEELAAFFDMTKRNWLAVYAKDKAIAEAFERGRNKGKTSLRRSQFLMANGDKDHRPNVTMLIWLGKQLLGQKDVVINEHFDGDSSNADDAKNRLYGRISKLAAARAARKGSGEPEP